MTLYDPAPTLLLEGGDVQVLLQVLFLQLLEGPVFLHRGERLVYTSDELVALLEEDPELLVARVLPDHGRVLDLEVAQVDRGYQVGDEYVDLAALQRGLGVVGGVVDFGVLRGLYRLVDEVEGGRADLCAYGQVLEVGDALRVGGWVILHHEHALSVVEVAFRKFDGFLTLGGNGDLIYIKVEVFGAGRVGLVERLDDPLYRKVHALGDLVCHVALVPRIVLGVSFEPGRVCGPVRGDRKLTLRVERGVFHAAPVRGPRLFRRLSAAAGQQQGDEEEPDRDKPLSQVFLRSTLWMKDDDRPQKRPGPSYTATSIDSPRERCNRHVCVSRWAHVLSWRKHVLRVVA